MQQDRLPPSAARAEITNECPCHYKGYHNIVLPGPDGYPTPTRRWKVWLVKEAGWWVTYYPDTLQLLYSPVYQQIPKWYWGLPKPDQEWDPIDNIDDQQPILDALNHIIGDKGKKLTFASFPGR